MGKLIVFFCFALLAMTLVIAGASGCAAPGISCTSDADCCGNFQCNLWAKKCTGGPGGWGPGGPWGLGGPAASGVEWGPPAQ